MNGTVTPSVVVVVSISSAAGGFSRSYGLERPLAPFEFVPGHAAAARSGRPSGR